MAFSMKLPADKKPLQSASGGGAGAKQYGLIIPTKKDAKKEIKPASIFGSVAELEADAPRDQAEERRRVGAEAARSFQKAQVERTHEKALAEDASVFDYDGVYDQIQSSRQDKKAQRKAQRESEKQSSKYISTLIEKAKVREIEQERIKERRLLKERASEDALYGDKEKLISASYKRKLQEMKRWDEEDRRIDEIEAAEDVTKRGGDAMAGFYSNLLTKNLAMGGSTSNARSAYTVGRGETATETEKHRDEVDERSPDTEESARKPEQRDAALDQSDESDRAVKKPKIEDESDHGERENRRREKKPEPEAPTVSKDEVISAARARFLARKAARQQEQQS